MNGYHKLLNTDKFDFKIIQNPLPELRNWLTGWLHYILSCAVYNYLVQHLIHCYWTRYSNINIEKAYNSLLPPLFHSSKLISLRISLMFPTDLCLDVPINYWSQSFSFLLSLVTCPIHLILNLMAQYTVGSSYNEALVTQIYATQDSRKLTTASSTDIFS
jgi:hypothetical protein